MTRLTIAIPSYNRVPVLQNSLRAVASELPSWAQLLIVDNASNPAITLGPDIERILGERGVAWRIARNPANIGGGANIVRCFEEVDTDWFLLCGDDDVVDPAGLQVARALIEQHPDAAFIKCSSRFHHYEAPVVGQGPVQLLQAAHNYGGLLFMSSFLFNRKLCLPFLRFAYLATAAYAPQVAVALLATRQHPFVLSPTVVARANEHDPAWSPVDVMLCAYHLADLPLDRVERRSLVQFIYRAHNVGRELLDVVTILRTPAQRDEGRFLRRKAIRTHLFHGGGIKRWAALAGLLLSPYPGAWGQRLLSLAYLKRTGRSSMRTFRDRHAGL